MLINVLLLPAVFLICSSCASLFNGKYTQVEIQGFSEQDSVVFVKTSPEAESRHRTPARIRVRRGEALHLHYIIKGDTQYVNVPKEVSATFSVGNLPTIPLYGLGYVVDLFNDRRYSLPGTIRLDPDQADNYRDIYPCRKSLAYGIKLPLVSQFYVPDSYRKGLYNGGILGFGLMTEWGFGPGRSLAWDGVWAARDKFFEDEASENSPTQGRLDNWHTSLRYQWHRGRWVTGTGAHYSEIRRTGQTRDRNGFEEIIIDGYNRVGIGPSFSLGFDGFKGLRLGAQYHPMVYSWRGTGPPDERFDYFHYFNLNLLIYVQDGF